MRSCIVIGAGLAGLSAARYLCRRGWSVTVLESRDRFGGRVWSYRFPGEPDLTCELGAEWIGFDHKKLRALCEEVGLRLVPHQYGFSFWNGGSTRPRRWYRPGAWPFTSVSRRDFDRLGRQIKRYSSALKKDLDQLDWWTRLSQLGFSEADLLIRDLMDSTDFGESIRMTSAYAAATEYFGGNATDEMDFKIPGGNDRLINALVTDIQSHGGTVLKHSPVSSVQQTASAVIVSVGHRAPPLTADFCICTVPARALLDIDWSPQLPEDQRQAAHQLQYARIVKTAVLYNRRFWKRRVNYGFSAFTGRVSDFCFDSTYLQPGRRGILCSYAIGDKADDIAKEPNPTAVMSWITEDMIHVVRPRNKRTIRSLKVVHHAWQQDRYTGGAYALYRPGQWYTVRPLLQRPHRRVHFAGEHLAEWQGFMEGAVDTGLAAAQTL
jgi:monoamine oxidase